MTKLTTKSVIYSIINLKNNKMYIGSAVNFRLRYNQHMYDLRRKNHHSPHFQRSWEKYGKDNFSFEIIELVDDKTKLLEREQVWLDLFKPEYNICKVAGSQLGRTWTLDEEKRLNISKGLTGRKLSEEHKKNLGLLHKGKAKTEEQKLKISLSKKGKPWTEARIKAQLLKKKHD